MAKRGIMRRVASYFADILTLTRFLLAVFLMVLIIVDGKPEWALIVFSLGELTDAFDGACSKKWPFEKGKEPKYRKHAEKYDIFTDLLLLSMMALYVVIRVNVWMWFMIGIVVVFCTVIELIAYHRIMGHPNDCSPKSLYAKNPEFTEKLLLFRRKIAYIPSIITGIILALLATSWSWPVRGIILGVAAVIGIFLWFFLRTRRKKVARD